MGFRFGVVGGDAWVQSPRPNIGSSGLRQDTTLRGIEDLGLPWPAVTQRKRFIGFPEP